MQKNGIFMLIATVAFGWFLSASQSAVAASGQVLIEVLERQDCAHCQAERAYLEDLDARRDDIMVRFYDIATPEGGRLFDQVTEKAGFAKATPVTVVGATLIQGFDAPETTGKRFEYFIEHNRNVPEQGFDAVLAREGGSTIGTQEGSVCESDGQVCRPVREPVLVRIPFTSVTFDLDTWSLPAIAAIIGFVDGFNPCAMWVLVTFLLVLVQMGSRRRMWTVAGLFIMAESVMYYLILNVWFKVWDFVGMDQVVTPVVGVVALGGGAFFLYEWYKSLGTEMACRVIDMEERSKIVRKIKSLASGRFTIMTALGVIVLAFSVNVIEFACSIGYPQTFTKILEMNALGFWQTQGMMALYILFYMVDDFLVFGLALWGFEKIHLTESYSRWSALIGGVLMLVLGYLLLFSPEFLRSFS